jgi:subfamily B ATP-binding cassette protein MsbA
MQDFRRLLKYLQPHRLTFALASVAMVLTALFETATGALLVPIAEQAFGVTGNSGSSTLFGLEKVIYGSGYPIWQTIAVLLVIFTLAKGVAEYFSSYLMARIGQVAIFDLRRDLYTHLLMQSAVFFENHRTNFLVSRLVNSAAAIELAVTATLRDMLRESFMLIGFIGAAFYFSWRLTLASLILAPVIALITSYVSKSLRRLAETSLEGAKTLTDTAQESLANHTVVKAYRAEPREHARFSTVASLIARANLKAGKIAALSPPTIELIGVFAIIALLFFGLREIDAARMNAAQFFTFLFFLLRSYDPMRKISRQHNQLNQAFAAAKDIWDVLDENTALPEKSDAAKITGLNSGITLNNVSFKYQKQERIILDHVSLKISKGQMIALVGESGGGKSTLTKLIPRFYDPTDGSMLWDGYDLRDVSVSSLRANIALVTQETILFNDSVRYNISYGNTSASDSEIIEAAKVAFADDFIRELPKGYDTIVGERGVFLSGGQRQRIAIARAVLLNAPVLILDEATSALDAESERLVQKALENLMRNRTSIVIAHRLSTVRRADKIVVMQRGRIIEIGTHDELLAKSGVYTRLYELQFMDDKEELEQRPATV